MFKLTTSSIFALLSILGFGYSVSSYSNPASSSEISKVQSPLPKGDSFKLIKSPLIKVNGVKLDESKTYTLAEIENRIKNL